MDPNSVDPRSIVNIGDLAKPATALIEKISMAVTGIAEPYQIRRVAQAEADAMTIRATAQIEIEERQRRALERFVREETRKQENIEEITRKAIPDLNADARPTEMNDDWVVNFFDKARLISDEQMQVLWARILAGEANAPGHFSKRTVNIVAQIDNSDAELFSRLLMFSWDLGVVRTPLVFDETGKLYFSHGINYRSLLHLEGLGLITLNETGNNSARVGKVREIAYFDELFRFDVPSTQVLQLGKVLFQSAGEELATICTAEKNPEFLEFVKGRWAEERILFDEASRTFRYTPPEKRTSKR